MPHRLLGCALRGPGVEHPQGAATGQQAVALCHPQKDVGPLFGGPEPKPARQPHSEGAPEGSRGTPGIAVTPWLSAHLPEPAYLCLY